MLNHLCNGKLRSVTFAAVFIISLYFLNISSVFAENSLTEKQKISSVLNTIYHLLLTDDTPGGPIGIELGKPNTGSYGYLYGQGNYKDGLEIRFKGQSQNITFCFNAVDVQAGEISVQLNGQAINSFQSGENCFTFTAAQQLANNVLTFIHNSPGNRWGINNIAINLVGETWLTLPVLNRFEWDNLAVRKVLQTFAFGGHATDHQIQLWSEMDPKLAIQEMLNFEPHNFKLSPLPPGEKYTQTASLDGTFWEFREHLRDHSSTLPMQIYNDKGQDIRKGFGVDYYNSQGAWVRMTLARGFNPFRQKIGFWETNYHMAVNLDTAVTNRQLTYYYDLIMNAHAAGLPYHQVIATAAKSAAVAAQYGHGVENTNPRRTDDNRWTPRFDPDKPYNQQLDYNDMFCQCNQDFAREIHQLFFGILGEQDPLGLQHHEDVTIPETAKALTDMRLVWINDGDNSRWPETVNFQTEFHHTGNVDILNTTISGANAAQKIDAIAKVAIRHPESKATLPVWIIEGLAEDDISPQDKTRLRAAWAAMPDLNKNFLEFIQAYAVSDLFHAPDRVKYTSSIDRMVYIGNKLVLNNTEALADFYNIGASWAGARSFSSENVEVFAPLHNVFGGQTGIEASDAAAVMENNYNRFADSSYQQTLSRCDACDNNGPWGKNWASVIPKLGGSYKVENVAAWLWQHFVGDGGKNYTQVERAHIVSILATSSGLNQLYCVQQRRIVEGIEPSNSDISNNRTPLELLERDNPWNSATERRCDNNLDAVGNATINAENALLEHGFTSAELQNGPMTPIVTEMANRTLALDSDNPDDRADANGQIGKAINFILATPFIMAQEAR